MSGVWFQIVNFFFPFLYPWHISLSLVGLGFKNKGFYPTVLTMAVTQTGLAMQGWLIIHTAQSTARHFRNALGWRLGDFTNNGELPTKLLGFERTSSTTNPWITQQLPHGRTKPRPQGPKALLAPFSVTWVGCFLLSLIFFSTPD